jgi:hypothetical protein
MSFNGMQKYVWGHRVMVLNMFNGPNERVDVGGRFWGTWPGSSKNAGKMRIMVNTAELAIEPERVMDYEEYMRRYKDGSLPDTAAKKPWFLEGI